MSATTGERLAPGPSAREVPGVLAELRKFGPPVHRRLFQRFGDIVRLQAGPFITHFLFHPDDVKHVLQDAHKSYSKATYGGRRALSIFGNGLLMSEGQAWVRQRRLTQAAFVSRDHPRILELTRVATLAALERWRAIAERRECLDVDEELSDLTFLIIARVLMNSQLDAAQAAGLRRAFDLSTLEGLEFENLGSRSAIETDPGADEFKQSLDRVHEIVLQLVAERRAKPEQDILTMLIEAGRNEPAGFSDDELRDQIKSLFFAGHETTARTAAFALMEISKRPELARRLREEAESLSGPGTLLEKVAELRYTDALVKEVMRVYPVLWSLERRALVDDSVRGYTIPAGSSVVLSPVVTHEHPGFWDDPSEFRPERFLDDGCPRHRLAYFPFGGGPRICIGSQMAPLELKLMLALTFRELYFEPKPGFEPELTANIAYRFKNGMHLCPRGW